MKILEKKNTLPIFLNFHIEDVISKHILNSTHTHTLLSSLKGVVSHLTFHSIRLRQIRE
jgi:hypothetical protein